MSIDERLPKQIDEWLSNDDNLDEIIAIMETMHNEELEQKINDDYKAWMTMQ